LRPNEPIPFIANFMLKNKHTVKPLDEYLKANLIPDKTEKSEENIINIEEDNVNNEII
jgi:hypothetical protein